MLRETLESSRQLESSLLIQAKELSVQLAQQRRVLDKAASFPDGDTSESGRLRQILLTHQNEIDMSGERTGKLDQQIKKWVEFIMYTCNGKFLRGCVFHRLVPKSKISPLSFYHVT